jgi:hypothetical protein
LPKHEEGWAFGAKDIVLHPHAMGEGSSVIPHEFSHNIQFHLGGFRNSPYVGWFWECHANWSAHQWHPAYPAALEVYVDRAHYELSSTRMNYGSWVFLQYLAEHPLFGHSFCYRIWEENRKNERDESIEDPFQTIMRVAVEMGVFKGDGLRDFGDIIGETAAHMVAWDFTHQYFYRRAMLLQGDSEWSFSLSRTDPAGSSQFTATPLASSESTLSTSSVTRRLTKLKLGLKESLTKRRVLTGESRLSLLTRMANRDIARCSRETREQSG